MSEPEVTNESAGEEFFDDNTDEQADSKPAENVRFESDQEKMILELFDGKYIE